VLISSEGSANRISPGVGLEVYLPLFKVSIMTASSTRLIRRLLILGENNMLPSIWFIFAIMLIEGSSSSSN
jgi:hypothetical protein